MLNDGLLSFVPETTPLSLVAGAGVSVPSSRTIDLLGPGVGQPPPSIIGNVSVFQTDMGIGLRHPEIAVGVAVTFTTSNAATLNVALQGAPDTGVGGGYQPGTWFTIVETGPLATSLLLAKTIIARIPLLPSLPHPLPRYIRLLFQVPAGTNFTAGVIGYANITYVRDDIVFGANNFVAVS